MNDQQKYMFPSKGLIHWKCLNTTKQVLSNKQEVRDEREW